MTRRGNGEGSIYARPDGRWAAAYVIDGRRRTVYARTRGEVAKKLSKALRERDEGLRLPTSSPTVAAFLSRWLISVELSPRPSNLKRYEELVRIHTVPTIRAIRLDRLTSQHVADLYAG